ncbi:hypothetical protein [Cohnella sp. AR92]|uniref:hypothetical protein n=1 Tax=Cohnella sp. AR92 TaxID=648716 RepID=UPI000F8D7960|nr:hypothetical protein [Cohnella sp. AR92]RUS46351.1 hypothetical protein ELR57_14845 [Cohnella sp. AR92]
MTRSWRWIVGFGGFGAVLTFLFSIGSNPPVTTIIRSFYAFIAFAVLAFAIGTVLGTLLKPSASPLGGQPEEERGSVLDLATPEDDSELSDLMKSQWSSEPARPAMDFQPLQPSRLVSVDNVNTEDMVQAVRRMKDE